MLHSLQRLQLWCVRLASVTSLLQLTDAPQLTSLTIDNCSYAELQLSKWWPNNYTETEVRQLAAAVPGMLQRLPRLSVLELPDTPLSDAAVQQLAAMQGLRQVGLAHVQHMPVCDLQRMPNSITKLRLNNYHYGEEEPSLPPQLQQFTALLHLHLQNCVLPPSLLGSVTQLQTLHLDMGTLLPINPEDDFETEGTAALLDVLPKLARLRELRLESVHLDTTSIAAQRFSALTAPSHLTTLVVQAADGAGAPLPKGAIQHMFPAHRRRPQLQWLEISTADCDTDAWCIDSAGLSSIVSCCRALELLDISYSVQPGADLSLLLQLPDSCVELYVGGAAFPDAAAAVVVQLTQAGGS